MVLEIGNITIGQLMSEDTVLIICRQRRKTHKTFYAKKRLHFLRHLLFKSFLLKQTEETKICREMRESHKYSALIVNRIPDRFSKRAG